MHWAAVRLGDFFEVSIFLAWSISLMNRGGPTYRLSLMGAFTAALVVLLQEFALNSQMVRYPAIPVNTGADSSLELHTSISIVAYGSDPGSACVAGVNTPCGAPA